MPRVSCWLRDEVIEWEEKGCFAFLDYCLDCWENRCEELLAAWERPGIEVYDLDVPHDTYSYLQYRCVNCCEQLSYIDDSLKHAMGI